jgi:hypothetical protein
MDDSKNGTIELPVQTGKAIPHRGIDQELGFEQAQTTPAETTKV